MTFVRNIIGAAAIAASTATGAYADTLAAPAGEVLLAVTGAIEVTNDGDRALFDLEMLRGLGETSFTTTTPWTEGAQTFSGPTLKAVLDSLGVRDGAIMATAINDYAVEIPVADAVEDGPIIALTRNGEDMSVRDKGPLWIVYPYDSKEDYKAEVIYSRSIWQLDRIVVTD